MAQFGRPASTITGGGWAVTGAATAHEATDEVTPNGDTDYCEADNADTALELKFSSVTDPTVSTGHVLRFEAEALGGSGAGEKIDISLYQGTTLIGLLFNNQAINRNSYQNYSATLSAGQANSISDYSDLRVRFDSVNMGGSETIRITQAEIEVPDAVGATYDEDVSLAVTNKTLVPTNEIIFAGLITLAITNKTLSPVSLVDYVVSLSLDITNRVISNIGNIDTPQTLETLNRVLSIASIGGLAYAVDLSFGKSKGITSLGVLVREGLLSLGKNTGISSTAQLDAVGAIVLNTIRTLTLLGLLDIDTAVSFSFIKTIALIGGLQIDDGIALDISKAISSAIQVEINPSIVLTKIKSLSSTSQLDAVVDLLFPRIEILTFAGNVVIDSTISLTRDLGIAPSAQVDFNTALGLAKNVLFIATHEYIAGSGIPTPHAEGTVTLVEQAGGFVEMVEQAQGNIVLVETETGIIIFDLTL